MTLYSEKKVFFASGNLKDGKGTLEGIFPACYNEPDIPKSQWQVNISYISFLSKNNVPINSLVYISTNLIRDYKVNNFGEAEIWNPYILHLHLLGTLNSYSISQNWLPMSSFSSKIVLYFTEMSENKPFVGDIDIKATLIIQRKY